jgi:hypothetical protein
LHARIEPRHVERSNLGLPVLDELGEAAGDIEDPGPDDLAADQAHAFARVLAYDHFAAK